MCLSFPTPTSKHTKIYYLLCTVNIVVGRKIFLKSALTSFSSKHINKSIANKRLTPPAEIKLQPQQGYIKLAKATPAVDPLSHCGTRATSSWPRLLPPLTRCCIVALASAGLLHVSPGYYYCGSNGTPAEGKKKEQRPPRGGRCSRKLGSALLPT